ncbi:TonB-dependent receptor [Tenacibaculum amylolyticum]|uniref:TonB-dependent receptor n=1 Tax=Tenacibaculum amylolyticum TaxID=104269 RepID=UPI003893562A
MKKSYILMLIVSLFFSSFTTQIHAQSEKKITIVVKDTKNKPVSGAVILFDNVRQKRWTNAKGVFKTKFTEAPKEISAFSQRIGISKVKYNGSDKVEITLKSNNDFKISGTPIQKNIKAIQYRDFYDYLRGQVPGVNVSMNNIINIRGYNSVNGSTTPLFVLNNNAIDQELLENIVPTTIKSVVVLKGPDASKYGSRGGNGVIEIYTY